MNGGWLWWSTIPGNLDSGHAGLRYCDPPVGGDVTLFAGGMTHGGKPGDADGT